MAGTTHDGQPITHQSAGKMHSHGRMKRSIYIGPTCRAPLHVTVLTSINDGQ